MKKITYLSVLIALLVAACSGGNQPDPSQVEAGKRLFEQAVIGSNAGCVTCHSREAEVILVGPSLAGIATHATEHMPGMATEDYLRQSIVEPNAAVMHGFSANVMPSNWAEVLTPEQIDQLVAYLLTLK